MWRYRELMPVFDDEVPVTLGEGFTPLAETGRYRLTFATGAWFASHGVASFHPEVVIVFEVRELRHHHVPLLLSPFGYSTYRGS